MVNHYASLEELRYHLGKVRFRDPNSLESIKDAREIELYFKKRIRDAELAERITADDLSQIVY